MIPKIQDLRWLKRRTDLGINYFLSCMAQYANNNFTSYIKEADLTKAVLEECFVPDNIKEVKMLHDFVKDILKEKGKQRDLDFDNILKKFRAEGRQ